MVRRHLLVLFSLLLLASYPFVWGQEKWALVIGVSHYPSFGEKLTSVPHATSDAKRIAQALSSPYCNFPQENVILLTQQQANRDNVLYSFEKYLAKSQPEDLIFIFFSGHGLISRSHSFYWLLHDTEINNIKGTSLSLNDLGKVLENKIAARNILICSDARRSEHSLGKVEWPASLQREGIFLLESSYDLEISRQRGEQSLFTHFLLAAMQGLSYFDQSSDKNGDGFVTISELADYTSWVIPLSGMRQRPIFHGKQSQQVFSQLFQEEAHVQILAPKTLLGTDEKKCYLEGIVRSEQEIARLQVQSELAQLQPISQQQAQQQALLLAPYTYHFRVPLYLPRDQENFQIILWQQDGNKQTLSRQISRRYRGWHGEWMPVGMVRADKEGVYLWQKDQSQMVYVPGGSYITGVPSRQLTNIQKQISQLREHMQKYRVLLKDNRKLRELLVTALEESDEAINKIGVKLQGIYRKVDLLSQVSIRPPKPEHQQPEKDIEHWIDPAIIEEVGEIHQFRHYFAQSRSLLAQCYHELQNLASKNYELSETILYLKMLEKLQRNIQVLWQTRIKRSKSFYIDLHELSNQKYVNFCHATSRPYPPDPWWQSNYIWEASDHPVVNVSWEDAYAYCQWAGKELPSAAQWEKAARGTAGNFYPWGNQLPVRKLANADVPPSPERFPFVSDLSPQGTEKVDSNSQGVSPYGCFHMSGNVWEWSRDHSDLLRILIPQLAKWEYRLGKGGSFTSGEYMLSSWFAHPFREDGRRSDLGFRCVVSGE